VRTSAGGGEEGLGKCGQKRTRGEGGSILADILRTSFMDDPPTDAYHPRPPNEVVRFTAEQTTVYRLAVRHRSVGRHQTFTVHRVNMLFDLAAVASAAVSSAVCLSHAPCTAAGTITRDGVAAAAGRGGYLTVMVKVVYFRSAGSNFDYQLLTS